MTTQAIAQMLREFQERCENLRDAGRDGSVPPRGVTNGLRRLEERFALLLQAAAIATEPPQADAKPAPTTPGARPTRVPASSAAAAHDATEE